MRSISLGWLIRAMVASGPDRNLTGI